MLRVTYFIFVVDWPVWLNMETFFLHNCGQGMCLGSRVVNQQFIWYSRLLCRVLATTIEDERKESRHIATWPGWHSYRGELLIYHTLNEQWGVKGQLVRTTALSCLQPAIRATSQVSTFWSIWGTSRQQNKGPSCFRSPKCHLCRSLHIGDSRCFSNPNVQAPLQARRDLCAFHQVWWASLSGHVDKFYGRVLKASLIALERC